MQNMKMPLAQVLYGDVVYWICVCSALCCAFGPLLALINIDNNVLNPHYLFSAIWQGKTAEEVWALGGQFPGGHFYLQGLFRGDAFTQFGLALGGGCALPALLVSAVAFVKERQWLWVCMSLWVSALIFVSATGLVGLGH